MRNLDGRGFDFRQLHHPTAYEAAGRTTPSVSPSAARQQGALERSTQCH